MLELVIWLITQQW